MAALLSDVSISVADFAPSLETVSTKVILQNRKHIFETLSTKKTSSHKLKEIFN